jgi:hypothetical protein
LPSSIRREKPAYKVHAAAACRQTKKHNFFMIPKILSSA